jgi:hypothetical protein
MTRRTNARVAGVAFLVYIAAGIASLALSGRTNVTDVLAVFTSLSALVLGVTLYAITRDVDHDLAMLALICRVVEGVPGHGLNAVLFAVASTIFSWLLLRGRMIPAALAWLGVIASAALVVILMVQRAGVFGATGWYSSATWLIWLPMLVFELTFAGWLIVKGVAMPAVCETAQANAAGDDRLAS